MVNIFLTLPFFSWLAVMALVFIAVGVPIGVTAACLINTLCRVREYVSYKEAKRRELESRVSFPATVTNRFGDLSC